MNSSKSKVVREVIEEMDHRINYSLLETSPQEREDLKQEIYVRLIATADKMEFVPLSTFKQRYEE